MQTEGNAQTGREHEVGTLSGPLLQFYLEHEIQQLQLEGRWQIGHTAKTLVKYENLRVVLIAMNAGGRVDKHRTLGRISVQCLRGRIRFRTDGQSAELSAGQMLTLDSDIPHDVEAVSDSAFLLSIALPSTSA